MADIVRVQDNGADLVDYLGAIVNVETHYQEVTEIKQELIAADKKAQRVRPAPAQTKAIFSWKLVVGIAIVGLILLDFYWYLGLAAFAGIAVYVYSRIKLSKDAYKKDVEMWNEEVFQNEQIRANIAVRLSEINSMINNCSSTLKKLYNAGPLHPDYQNLPACATFYDWFSKGMTVSLSRNGSDPGAYVMYEEKLRHGELMGELGEIKAGVNAIKETQARLYQAVVEIKNTVSTISLQLIGLQATASTIANNTAMMAANTADIKNNTAVSAYYSKVNADNAAALNKYVGAPYYR